MRYAMAVDTVRCVGCSSCAIACKTENAVPDGGFRCWVETDVRGRFPSLSMEIHSERCNQCSEPACVAACPTGASFVAEGGVVGVERSKCTGCKACIAACPYGARFVDPRGFVDKCTFCLHRVKRGLQPACVANCPAQALTFGDLEDRDSPLAQLLAARRHYVLHPERGTKPNLYFLERA